jgi:hypothetical protein
LKLAAVVAIVVAVGACKQRRDDSSSPPPPQSPSNTVAAHAATPDAATTCTARGAHTCSGDAVVECTRDGRVGPVVQSCKAGCRDGACVDTCATQGAALVYLVDHDNELLSFDPEQLAAEPFHVVAKLACPGESSRPFSMAVQRTGIAWVMFDDGQLFRVSIVDGHCAAAPFERDHAPATFGMGFTHTGSGSDGETLYTVNSGPGAFGTLDVTAEPEPAWRSLGTTERDTSVNAPDLTGTRNGELFGYFAETDGPSWIRRIDPATGAATTETYSVPSHGSEPQAWAFAHWGGVFYVFVTFDHDSHLYTVNRKTRKAVLVRDHLPYEISGAGVSTCAPELEAP